MNSTLAADVLRVVNLILGGGCIAVSLVVVGMYARIYRLHQVTARGEQDRWRGFLPRHVVLIGLSYLGLVVFSMSNAVLPRIHQGLTWRAPTLCVLYAIGLWATWDVLGHETHRIYAQSYGEDMPPPRPVRVLRRLFRLDRPTRSGAHRGRRRPRS